jgi:sarcosine oxidase
VLGVRAGGARPRGRARTLPVVGQVDCLTVRAPWLDAGGDGWTAARRGRVVAFVGSNLMKFAPLLGDRLAQAALSDELPSDLTP